MEGNGELTHVAMLSHPKEAAELIEQAAGEGRESIAIEI